MPRERTYTNTGYIEVQWAKNGQLVCIVSAELKGHADGCHDGDRCGEPSNCPPRETMHQFTTDDQWDLGRFRTALKRAKRQSFGEVPAVTVEFGDADKRTIDAVNQSLKRLNTARETYGF